MTRKIVLFMLVLSMLLCVVSCGNNKDVPKGMQLCESEFVNYKLYVPEKWTVDSTSGFVSAYCPDDKSSVSMLTMTGTRAYASVSEYLDEYKKTLGETYTGYEFIESESLLTGTTLGGLDAARLVFTIKTGETTYKYMQYVTASGFQIYTLTYTALIDNFDSHLDDLAKIVEYFTF